MKSGGIGFSSKGKTTKRKNHAKGQQDVRKSRHSLKKKVFNENTHELMARGDDNVKKKKEGAPPLKKERKSRGMPSKRGGEGEWRDTESEKYPAGWGKREQKG